MKKRNSLNRISAICAVLFLLSLAIPAIALAYSEDNPLVLKCGIDNPPKDVKSLTIKRMGEMVEKRTNGRIKFQYFFSSSLIKKPQFVDAVAKGIADISTGPISFVTGKIPELSPFEVYGAYDIDKTVEMTNEIRPLLVELFKKKNIYPVMVLYTGNTIFAHKDKFLKSPADWEGAKMRLAGRWQATLGRKWGASPVFLPPPAIYLAAQRGTIDGYMLIYDIINGLKLYEVAPYITDTTLSNNIEVVTFNLRKWNRLTGKDQRIINEVAAEVEPWNMSETLKVYDKIKKNIIANGGKIYELTEEEKAVYRSEAKTLLPEVKKVSGEMGHRFIKILEKYE